MTNADIPLQPMTEYEQFLFDLKGFLVIPAVLSAAEIQIVRDHMNAYTQDPNSLPEPHRAPIAGPAEFLIDHPRAMGILQTVIDPDPERIRLESVFISQRGIDEKEPWRPHVGGANVLPSFSYRYHNGRIYGGMTRVVWELNPVKHTDGGTVRPCTSTHDQPVQPAAGMTRSPALLSAPPVAAGLTSVRALVLLAIAAISHWQSSRALRDAGLDDRAGQQVHELLRVPRRLLRHLHRVTLCAPHRRSCRLCHLTKGGADHAAVDWDNEEVDRCSIFNCYNSLWAQWHKTNLSRKAPSIMHNDI